MHRVRQSACPLLLMLFAVLAGCSHGGEGRLKVIKRPLFNEERLALTNDYCRLHYGNEGHLLEKPQMIVVHYTAFLSLAESERFFTPAVLSREDIRSGGAVNVSAHFMVDLNGTIYRLAPDNVVCRHTIGFNHLALGIENVGEGESALTEAQLEADAALIADLVSRHPSIGYLLGHHEYQDKALPHYALRRELDGRYRPTVKIDPGERFMTRLRNLLKERYGMMLKR
ncbi:N-acetylmuramoyl-L-alanine amidase [Geomonas sp. RF6]|uniref:peptidoglycan recognition protein family protein n=1 Tax=Geomonas sp. RF6 TaxID=2897342 RepID=UPI001E5AACDE|nr:peptidoglycan recognition family protein [Geomonas sp. RF6]UFS70640.1 N-acetylmuramoyl-L-alanine amidase [Geomonas sp. RF6]